jgi:hypothetical protein
VGPATGTMRSMVGERRPTIRSENSKYETNRKYQRANDQNSLIQNVLSISYLGLEFVSDFEFHFIGGSSLRSTPPYARACL